MRTFTVVGSGDVLLHDGLWAQGAQDAEKSGAAGYDFTALLASVRPVVTAADLAICHLETPVGPATGPFSNYPLFSVPPQIAPALASTGYDSCSTASNHALDKGEAGIVRTLTALDRAGVKHAGTARTAAEANTPTLMQVNGVTVAHLSYTFSFNGLHRPDGEEWLANYLDPRAVLAAARRAKRAGAEVVIVSIHWGTEYQHEPNDQQISVAHQLLASPDIDLILGHHAHVVQPIERIGDKWVAYGMGNEVAWQNFSNDTRDGIIARFTFTEVSAGVFRITKAEAIPIHMWLDSAPVRVYDVAAVLHSPAAPAALARSCKASRHRTQEILGERGAFRDGLVLVE
jgi:poly-gamma-glutamate capsule biosynthesis protein CapA/YwtB (metallophosphatase superfamily)